MFRLDEELKTWVPHNYIGTFTEVRTVYGDSPDEFPEGSAVEPIILTEEQARRLNAVKGDSTVSLHDLIAYVMDGEEIPESDKYEHQAAFDDFIQSLPPEHVAANASTVIELVDVWKRNIWYEVGTYVKHENVLYRVLQAHSSQSDWPPDSVPALFAPVLTSPDGEPLEWVKPGATNAYMTGDRVKYNGKVYESTIDNNVWSPIEYPAGWKVV